MLATLCTTPPMPLPTRMPKRCPPAAAVSLKLPPTTRSEPIASVSASSAVGHVDAVADGAVVGVVVVGGGARQADEAGDVDEPDAVIVVRREVAVLVRERGSHGDRGADVRVVPRRD